MGLLLLLHWTPRHGRIICFYLHARLFCVGVIILSKTPFFLLLLLTRSLLLDFIHFFMRHHLAAPLISIRIPFQKQFSFTTRYQFDTYFIIFAYYTFFPFGVRSLSFFFIFMILLYYLFIYSTWCKYTSLFCTFFMIGLFKFDCLLFIKGRHHAPI